MSTIPTPQRRLTPEEYLAIERAAQFKSEFYHGRMFPLGGFGPETFAMAGGTRRHNRICINLVSRVDALLRGSPCEVFNSDMRVQVKSAGLYTYPDVSVACGNIQFADEHEDTLLNPRVLIEVLSPSTEQRDHGWKFQNYFDIPSLIDYVIVSQDKPFIEHFVRRADGTRMFEFIEGLDATLRLSAIDLSVPLRDIYFDVQFGPEELDEPPPMA